MKTTTDFIQRELVSELPDDSPQSYEVYIKNASDWQEIHDYIINENEIDGIPNRRISCISEMKCSKKRSVYEMSKNEAEILKTHPKVQFVTPSTLYNPKVLEQRKIDEQFDRHLDTNRYKDDITNRRTTGDPGSVLNFTQWGLSRHSYTSNNYGSSTLINEDIKYSLTGENVDVVIMDNGVRWDHPEFLLPEYTSVPVGVATETVSRVRDILIHGQDEYGIDWASEGLVAPGTGSLANYTKAEALQSETFNTTPPNTVWHGTHVAGTAAGNQFGFAFKSNIWSIACVDRSDLGFSDPSDGFDYIKVWHKNKPINPATGRKNPTIVNGSWGLRQFVSYGAPYQVNFRGSSYSSGDIEGSNSFLPPVYNISTLSGYYQFTSVHATSQATADEIFDDPDCKDISFVFSAGNSGNPSGKQDIFNGVDYNNQFTSGTFYYGGQVAETRGAVDEYFNRAGTPSIAHQGQNDAPISVGSLDNVVVTSGITSERKSNFSNTGPAIDIWSAGSNVLSSYGTGYADPRNGTYLNGYISGTSMAAPQVTGVIALYLESNPSATRVDSRNWLLKHGSVLLENGPGNPILDTYKNVNPIGAGTSVSYWSDTYGLKGATARILYNPFANNTRPSISGVNISGISFKQS